MARHRRARCAGCGRHLHRLEVICDGPRSWCPECADEELQVLERRLAELGAAVESWRAVPA